jgi:hypothetical protein
MQTGPKEEGSKMIVLVVIRLLAGGPKQDIFHQYAPSCFHLFLASCPQMQSDWGKHNASLRMVMMTTRIKCSLLHAADQNLGGGCIIGAMASHSGRQIY